MPVSHDDVMDQLHATLMRVFRDGVLDDAERAELSRLYRHGGLTVAEVKDVFSRFVREVWGEVMVDGVVTDDERARLAEIVRELKLRPEMLPDALRQQMNFA